MEIQELLDAHRIEYAESGHHHCRPGWIQLQECPHCSSTNYHCGYNLRSGYFNCWSCGGHRAWPTLQAMDIPIQIIREFLGGTRSMLPNVFKVRGKLVLPKRLGPLLPAHQRYLASRGLEWPELERAWLLQGLGIAPPLSWRIFIPILEGERLVSWTSRAIGETVKQRYISASAEQESRNHKELVYGVDYCLHSIVIVEGPVDVWRIGPGAGGLFGTSYTQAQVLRLSSIPYRFICFDSERKAQAQAMELMEQLAGFPGETVNIRLESKDPGSASVREIKRIRQLARL